MKKVVLISGAPGSGKTTLAKIYSQNIYNKLEYFTKNDIILDDISTFVNDVNNIFEYVQNVDLLIITDPHLSFERNLTKAKVIFNYHGYDIEHIHLEIPIEIALLRVNSRHDGRKISREFLETFY